MRRSWHLLISMWVLVLPLDLAAQTFGVNVTPDGAGTPNRTTHTAGYTQVFTIQNTGSDGEFFSLLCWGVSNITCSRLSQTVVFLNAGGSTNVTATYATANEGTGGLWLEASGSAAVDWGSVTVPVVLPAGAPKMSVLPYVEARQDLGLCAVSCFATAYNQGTVPYLSLDTPRNVTLVYHGDRVAPKPFVAVDVWPDPTYGTWPSEYQLQVKVNGALVTFVNGEQTLRFTGTSGSTVYRLAGQFDASSYTHGVGYPMEILVTAKIGTSLFTNRWITTFLSVNEANSAIARGWTIAGVQRLFGQSDGSKLITEGNGSATYFRYDNVALTLTAPLGDVSTLKASGANWVRAYPDSTKVTFNSAGYLTSVADRWGNTTSITYDGSNRVWQVKDPLNNAITLAYGANGLATITDPFSRVTTLTVQANRTLTAFRDPDNISTTFGYDGSLRLSSITNRDSKTTTRGYDTNAGKLATITAPAVPVYGSGTVSPVTTLASWQKVGVPYGSTATTTFNPVRADTVYGRVTEPGGAVTRFTVNRWGTPAVTTNALGETTTVSFSVAGRPVKVVAPGYGAEFDSLAYNASGLLTYQKSAKSTVTTIVYGGWAQPTTISGTGQQTVVNTLGANGRVTAVSVGGTTVQQFTQYDSFGRVMTAVDGAAATTTYGYATTGHRNLNSITAPGNRQTTFGHDNIGRQTTVTLPNLPSQTTFYSPINRIDSVKVATNPVTVTKYGYNGLYLTSVTDPKNQTYGYGYNALGWQTSETDPVGRSLSFQYSLDGDVRQATNRRSQAVTLGYDALHRPTSQAGSSSMSWSYQNNGYLVTATSPTSTETSYFNVRGQPDSVRTVLVSQTYWQRFLYTQYGLLDSVTVTGPGGVTFQGRKYLWDEPRGVLQTIRLAGAATASTVDGNLNPTNVLFPGGDSRVLTRGSLEAPIKLGATSAPYSNTTDRWLGYNPLGQIDKHMGYPDGDNGRFFTYDSLGQLRKGQDAQRTPGSLPSGCPSSNWGLDDPLCPAASAYTLGGANPYTYDAVGNRTDLGGSYTTGNRITAFGSCTYGTDFDGNVTSKSGGSCAGAASLFWNAEGQLDSVHVTATNTGLHYLYDASGRLVLRRKNGTAEATFLWQGDNLLAELNGTATAKVAEYSYYPGLDNPHAVVLGSTRYYAQVDGLGNVIALTSEAKALKSTYIYDDWGASAGVADSNRARFKGALWLGPEIDIYFMRNRWYEPASGRFLSEDPIGLEGGINPSVFANGNPVNGRDPSGLAGLPQCREGYALYGMFAVNPDGSRGRLIGELYCKYVGGSTNDRARSGGPGGPSREAVKACMEQNRFSSLFGDGVVRDALRVAETASLISIGTDLVAIARKGGGALGTTNPYASGFNMIGRAAVKAAGRPDLIGRVNAIGGKVTPTLAVLGAFTGAYNTTIELQCRAGVLQ